MRAAVLSLAAALFAYAAAHRIVDDDEGYYALAGRAMLAGQVPYRDFFLPQLPLGPLAYGIVSAAFGPGLMPLRFFAAACALGTTWLVERAARDLAGTRAGLVAVVLLVTHSLFWEWAATIKTFPLALLFGTAALALCARGSATPRRMFVAGAFAGLAVGARALSLPIAASVVAAPFFISHDSAARLRLALFAGAGVGVALLPIAVVASLDPGAFYFDNIGYHALRSPGEGLVKDLPQKLGVARAVFLSPLGANRPDATGIQTTALFVAAILAVRSYRRQRDSAAFAVAAPFGLAAALLAVTSLIPSPTWSQYFAACVPPASVLAASLLARESPRGVLSSLLLAAYVAVSVPAFHSRLVAQPGLFRPAAFDAVARSLDEVSPPGVPVAAHEPAYLVASRRSPLLEAMNPYARRFSLRLSGAERRRYRLFTEPEFCDAILRSRATFVAGMGLVPETALPLKSAGWTLVSSQPGSSIWAAPRSHDDASHR
jgi:4-amino-4-deoxy-L-arabinose transferase-like glycosyltransferase